MRIKGCLTVNDTNIRNITHICGLNLKYFKNEMKIAKNHKKIMSIDILSNMTRFTSPKYRYSNSQEWFSSYRSPEYDKTGCSDFIIIPPGFELVNPTIEISRHNPTYSYYDESTRYKTAIVEIDNIRCFIPYDDNFLEKVLAKTSYLKNVTNNSKVTTFLSINTNLVIDNGVLNC